MKRTYVDSNILISAFKGQEDAHRRAMEILDDPKRCILVSDYLRLEVLPKPTYDGDEKETKFMEAVLEAGETIHTSPDLTRQAIEFACGYGMKALDALHVSAAKTGNADELVTMEKPTEPMCRVQEIKVLSLYAADAR